MRRVCAIQKNNSTAVLLRHFFGWGGSTKFYFLFLLLLLTNIYSGFSQDRASEVPTYSHIGKEDLPTVTVNLLSFSVNTEDLTIAIATDPMGNVYTLSFGNGVDKRDADGNLLDANFINGLKNPLDIAIDAQGYIYIADFEASGDTYEDNGQIKIFDSSGNYVKSILTSYYRPLGVAVDEDFVYIAEYNDGEQGPESTPSSRVRKVSKTSGAQVAVNNAISVPYRIAVNSDGQVYVSKAGGGSAVLNLSPTLTVQGQLPGIQSPGSIEVDAFDYVHVLEYSGRIDFSRFINFTSLGAGEIQDIAEDIDKGIDAEAFGVKVYDPSLTLQYFFKQMIDFPVDIAFNSCDRMYINNGHMFGSSSWFGYIPEKMEFDLEIYQRSSSADVTNPVASCVSPFTLTLDSDGLASLTVDDIDDGSSDNCAIANRTLSQYSFTSADIGMVPVTLTVTDNAGQFTACTVNITVEAAAGPDPPEAVCKNFTVALDQNGEATITAAEVYGGTNTSLNLSIDVTTFSCSDLGVKPVVLTVTDPATGLSDTCTAQVTVVDNTAPVVSCVTTFTLTLDSEGTASLTVDDIEDGSSDNCGIANRTLSQYSFTSADIGVVPVILTITDTSGLSNSCTVNVTVEAAAGPEPPEAVCKNFTVALDQNGSATITAADVYGGTDTSLNLSIDITTFSCSDLGVKPVVLTVTDPATGLSDTCTAQISVVDNTAPVVKCVAPFTLTLDNDGKASLTVDDIDGGSSDNCGIANRTLSQYSFTSADIGTVPVTLTITDNAGQFTTCTVNVTIEAAAGPEPPEAECTDFTVSLDSSGVANITAADVYGGNDTSLNLSIDVSTFSCSDLGVKPVVLTVTDPATGLSNTCTAQVTITDTINPEFTCPADQTITLEAGEEFIVPNFEEVINASDNCSYTYTQQPPPGTVLTKSQRIEIHAIDEGNNDTWCSFVIFIEDEEAPLQISCPEDIEIDLQGECEFVMPDYTGRVSATEGAVISQSPEVGAVITDDTTITFTATLDNQTQTCETNLALTNSADLEIYCLEDHYVSTNADGKFVLPDYRGQINVTGNCGEVEIVQSPEVGTEVDKDTSITLTVTDSSGQLETCSFTIYLSVESIPLEFILCPSDTAIEVESDCSLVVPDYTTVAQVNNSNASITQTPPAGTKVTEDTEVILLASLGEESISCSFQLELQDTTDPVAVCVEEFTLHLNESGVGKITPEIFDRGSSDNCDFSMSLSKENFDLDDVGEQEVILTVTDAAGNTSTCKTTVTVEAYDEENPGINCVDELTLPLSQTGDFFLELNYTGDDENEDYTLSKETFSCEDIGTQFITVTYWGEYTGTCEIKVTVVDDMAPVIECLEEIDVRLNASGTASLSIEDLDLEYFDNCSVADSSLSRTSFTTADLGMSEITFTVTDGSGNSSTCTTTVNVLPFDGEEPQAIECVDLHVIQIKENGKAILNPRELFTGGTGSTQFTVSKDTFTCLDIGENTVTLEYTTPTGSGACEIKVVVEDPLQICGEPVDPSNGDYIIMYPNPSLGIVRFQTSPGLEIHRVEVFDMRGRYLFEKVYDQNSIFDRKLDLQEYQSGVYTILIYTNGKEYLKRAIIRN